MLRSLIMTSVVLAPSVQAQDLPAYPRSPMMTHPHNHWYDYDCCDLRDCRPAEKGELVYTVEGWLHVPSDVTLDYDSPRVRTVPSKAPAADRVRHHVCLRSRGDDFGEKGTPRCVYIAEPEG
jgi:hypothetical protein